MRHGDKSQVRDIHNKAERTTTDHDLTPPLSRALSNRRPTGPQHGAHGSWGQAHGVPRIQLRARPPGTPPGFATPCFPHPSAQHSARWQMASAFLAVIVVGGRVRVGDPLPSFPTRHHHHHTPPSAKTLPRTPCGPTTTLAESTRSCVPSGCLLFAPPRCPDGPAFLRKISKPACLDCPPLTRCVDHGPIAWEGIYSIFPLGFISLGAIRSLPNLSPPIGASPGSLPSPIGFCRLRPDLNFGKMDSILEEEEARGEPRRVASCPELQTLDAPPGQTSFFLAVMPAGHCPI